MRSVARPIPILPFLLFLVGVGAPMPGPASPLAAQDTLVVQADAPGAWGAVSVVEELRIGVLEGDERYVFGEVLHILPVPGDRVWVVDAQGPRIRIYDGQGRYVRDVGELGQGPGDFLRVTGLDLTLDGRVALWDASNSRISFYRPDGEFEGQIRVDVTGSGAGFRVDDTGRFWVPTGVINSACAREAVGLDGGETLLLRSEGRECIRPALLRISPEAGPGGPGAEEAAGIDTVFQLLPRDEERAQSFSVGLPSDRVEPFISRWTSTLSHQGIQATAHTARYTIDVHVNEPGGPRVIRIVRSVDPVRLTRDERAEWEAIARWYDRSFPESIMSDVEIPDTKPVLRYIRFDRDGRIWVRRYVEAEPRPEIEPPDDPNAAPRLTWREPPTYDVLEADGRFLGTVVLPSNVRLIARDRDALWGAARGEFNEDYVVRLTLRPL